MNDAETLARTIWGEARGEDYSGRIAVGCVIRNRVKSSILWWKRSPLEGEYVKVCRCPKQFSCWNEDDPNLAKLESVDESDDDYAECLDISKGLIIGEVPDITDGATHYYATSMKESPKWASKLYATRRIGRHIFLKEI